jgi:hypothetical protein
MAEAIGRAIIAAAQRCVDIDCADAALTVQMPRRCLGRDRMPL